jgi:pimeloyl-ACP methyl ester carboxylesterase
MGRATMLDSGCWLEVIDDAGHFLGIDQPEAFLMALRAALDPAEERR